MRYLMCVCYSQYMQRKVLLWIGGVGILILTTLLSVLFYLFHRDDNAPTVGFPVHTSVSTTTGRDTITITILIENTSGLPEQVHIVQPLPTGATVKAGDGGKPHDSSLAWDVFLLPDAPPSIHQIEIALGQSLPPTTHIPGTRATFSLPIVGFLINNTFTANNVALPERKSVTFDAAILPESAHAGSLLSVPVFLTNNSSTGIATSTIQITVEDVSSGKIVNSFSQTVTVQPDEHKKLLLSLPVPAEPGYYIVTEKATGASYVSSNMLEVTSP